MSLPRSLRPLPHARLEAVRADARERAHAARDPSALVAYQDKWTARIARLQRAHPERWHVPGWSPEEVRDALTLRLIEAILSPGESREPPTRDAVREDEPTKERSLALVEGQLALLRRTFRIRAHAMDLRDAPLPGRGPTEEERWIERESAAARAAAGAEAEARLSRTQRRWWSAMQDAARAGAFFQASAAPNLSVASRQLGKNRSSAHRAFRELQARFGRERRRFD